VTSPDAYSSNPEPDRDATPEEAAAAFEEVLDRHAGVFERLEEL